ncbi:hypothetical protein Taro_020939 [Colocasia esculenta]|uniref:Uncharacterized protein n=1 Tax=Colocasia esculenta TaxID=4460 RepID=A0A843V023_COLES|nr:hypothetical protein [Colocasia esculenta]
MARDLVAKGFRSCCRRGGRAGAVWTSSALLIYLGLRAAMENSRSPLPAADLGKLVLLHDSNSGDPWSLLHSVTRIDFDQGVSFPSNPFRFPFVKNIKGPSWVYCRNADHDMSNSDRRAGLYDKMARDLEEHGAAFLRGGETSQSLSLSDLFSVNDGAITAVLKPANPPVRANVLYLGPEFAVPISEAVREIFLPYFDKGKMLSYQFLEIEVEAEAVRAVAIALCPLTIILDRVVISGSDPLVIRTRLRKALPRAPEKQLYDPVMLHTSFARLLGPPNIPLEEKTSSVDQLQFFHELVVRINERIHGFKASVSELWFVEEFDVLALALNGRTRTHRFNLDCLGHNR